MSLRTIGLIGILALGLRAWPSAVEAQQAGKVYRIGYLRSLSGSPTGSPRQIAFRQRLRELGYIEGQNLVIEDRSAEGKHERYPDLAAELVRLKVDVIVTPPPSRAIRAVQRATRTIPIVMSGSNRDPVEEGFVASLARPGGNITGVITLDSELHGKRLELLKEAFPRISRVAILWSSKRSMKEIKAVGGALGIQVQPLIVTRRSTMDDIESAFSTISQDRPDALLVAATSFMKTNTARVIEFTARRRLPTIYGRSRFVKAGGLMSYSADRLHLSRRSATYVDKILKGANPANLPVERPTKFELIINLKTAKQLGITIPREVLFQAEKLIK